MHVNESELEWSETDREGTYIRRKQLGAAAGGEQLGCSLCELPPGERSWPYHYHTGNEEAIYVLAGTGTVRHGGECRPLEAGDYVAFLASEAGGHRVINDGDEPLRYLAMSTMDDPDVVIYPDGEAVGVYTGSAPGNHEDRERTQYFPEEEAVGYWEGAANPDE